MLLFACSGAQSDSLNRVHRNRKMALLGGTGLATGGSLIYLHEAWYRPYNTGKFHFFNDNAEWLQMDKAGHAYSSYQTGRLMVEAFRWAGFSEVKTRWLGGTVGVLYLTAIEVMDGFSRGWGFSWGDQAANLAGSALVVAQDVAWGEQKIQLKFAYFPSGIAKYNPSLLGENAYTRILKDYNAQSYWLSFNPLFFKSKQSTFPPWLNIALGYGANGMTGGHANNIVTTDEQGNVLVFNRERQFFLSLDLDLTKFRSRSRALRTLFSVLNVIKIPAPALGFSKSGLKFYPLK